MNVNKTDYIIKSISIVIATLYPFFCLFYQGYMSSLSQYWGTNMQPIFVLSNTITVYYLFTLKYWKISAIILCLVTAFSIEYYPNTHNILAVAFFIVNLWPLYKASNRFKHYKYIYLCSVPMVALSMLYAEMFAISTICIFHMHSLNTIYKLQKKRLS